jgi:methionine-rich copper-binding protein CopC
VKALKRYSEICLMVSLAVVAAFPAVGLGHAFPLRSDPRVGWTVTIAPPKVTIWFDGELEPAFSTITVYNSAKQKVDKGNSRVNGSDASVLEVDLPALTPGKYHVYWNALSKDTHVTQGDFSFAIEKK